MIQEVYRRYGRRNAAQVANVISYRPKSAVRDMAKALGHSVGQQDAWSKQIDSWGAIPVQNEHDIPAAVVELVPESVARENVVLPLSQENGALKIIMSDPSDFETVQKLHFILNKDVQPVLSPREQIVEAINRHYGQTDTESVDSMLSEFTDTAIDFTETSSAAAAAAAEDSDAPVIKLCNLMIQEASSLRASASPRPWPWARGWMCSSVSSK